MRFFERKCDLGCLWFFIPSVVSDLLGGFGGIPNTDRYEFTQRLFVLDNENTYRDMRNIAAKPGVFHPEGTQ